TRVPHPRHRHHCFDRAADRVGRRGPRDGLGRWLPGLADVLRLVGPPRRIPHAHRVLPSTARRRFGEPVDRPRPRRRVVPAEGAGLAFRDWPLMSGRLVPDLSQPGAGPMFAHRLLAIAVTALVAWCAVRARTMRPRSPRLVGLSTLALVLVLAQIAVGALNVVTELAAWARAAHVAVSALIWATVVALAVVARREPSRDDLRAEAEDERFPATADRAL